MKKMPLTLILLKNLEKQWRNSMTREAIEQQAKSYTLAIFDKLDDLSDITDAYVDGAEWMQEIMIEKACEWLKLNAEDYIVTCYDKGELDSEGLLMDFRKTMEE